MKPKLLAMIGLVTVALALAIVVALRSRTTEAPAAPPAAVAPAPAPATRHVPSPSPAADPSAIDGEDHQLEPPSAADTPPYPVDLEWLRAKLPDNRYWELGAPTSDPVVAKARAERAKRANTAYGRILSGEATEAEIRDYYDEKRRISSDYLALAQLVLKEKSEELPERDLGLFELSANLHRARLTQIERDLQDALTRQRQRAATGR